MKKTKHVGATIGRPHFEENAKCVGADSISAQKRNNGITLIALIITIIVMLILVGVSIQVALNTGLFDSAGKATRDWSVEQEKEQELASGKVTIGNKTYNSIDEYKESLVSGNEADKVIEAPQTYYKSFQAGDNITAYLVENAIATQANGETTYDMLFTGTGEMWYTNLWIDEVCNIEQVGPDDYEYEWIMLENVKISYGITNITAEAFYCCDRLKTVTIPSSVTHIGFAAFCNCSNLTRIVGTISAEKIDSVAFQGCSSLKNIVLSEGIINIESSAFSNCSSLISIEIPTGVTCIDDYTFFNCTGLTEIIIPTSVTSIGGNAFCYCDSLSTVIYSGTQSQWDSINIGANNECLTNVKSQT